MLDLSHVKWEEILSAIHQIADDPTKTRLDFQFGSVTVLVYRAGTVVRVDFKQS